MRVLNQTETDFVSYANAELSNGLRVIVASRPNTRMMNWSLLLDCGQVHGKPHLAHLVEHVTLMSHAKELATEVTARGMHYNGYVMMSETQYGLAGHVDDAQLGFRFMNRILQPLNVTDDDVKNECRVLAREYLEFGLIYQLWAIEYLRVFAGDKVAKKYRVPANVRLKLKLKAADCIGFQRDHVNAGAATLAVVSPLSVDATLKMAEENLSSVTANLSSRSPPIYSKKRRLNVGVHRYMPSVLVWHVLIKPTPQQRVAAMLLESILESTGALFQAIRVQNQLSYGVRTGLMSTEDSVGMHSCMMVASSKVAKAVRLIGSVIEELCSDISEQQFQQTQYSVVRKYDFYEDQPGQLAWLLASNAFRPETELTTPVSIKEAVMNLTREQLIQTARQMFSPENRHVALSGMYGPRGWWHARRFAHGK